MGVQIRNATDNDIARMVELSDQKRTEYEAYSPVFWHKAADGAEKQAPFLTHQLTRENNIVLVAEDNGKIEGFVIATIVNAPPVYDPGGLVCMIDDYTVSSPELWDSVGKALLDEATSRAKAKGAVLSVIVSANLDQSKRAMLTGVGAKIGSEWWVKPI